MDLRPKVLKAIERVEQKSHISRTFGISRNTIDLWPKQRDQTGSVAPKSHCHRGQASKIDDLGAFREFATAHGHLTQQ